MAVTAPGERKELAAADDRARWCDLEAVQVCGHEWLNRPESDTRKCLICGVEQ